MSYIDKSLAPNEEILVRGKWPMLHWIGAWLALILLGWIVVGIFIFIASAIHMSVTQFAVTDRRVVLKRGWLNVRTQELATESVEGVQLEQSIWGKLFGFGHILVTGTGDARIVFPPMARPIAFRRAIEAARHGVTEVHIAHDDIEEIGRAARADQRERHEA
jgi:uncharacterized membrane protein YdbT with pleckstrin-like domain